MAVEIEQAALVLHRRPYRETSLLVTFFTPEHGKMNAIIRGVRSGSKASTAKQAWLQPFQTLNISWIEKNAQKQPGLVSLRQLEPTNVRFPLMGDANICGLYLNELLYRLLYPNVGMDNLFAIYQQSLFDLAKANTRADQAWVLRQFEFELLLGMGYAIPTDIDATQKPINAEQRYQVYPELGAVIEDEFSQISAHDAPSACVSGYCLLQFSKFKRCDSCLTQWKKLFRLLLSTYLGDKPIQSRLLFIQ